MDEQNMIQTSVQGNSLRNSINALRDAKESIKLRKADEQQKARVNEGLNLYEAWFNTQNEQLKKKYDVASRGAELAWMIVDYWKSKWITISWTDAEIIDTYLKGNPQKSKMLYDYTHGDMDPEEFAIEMWRMEAPQPQGGFLRNVIWGAWDAATWLGQFIWNSAADIIWWTAKKLGADDDRVDFLVSDFKKYLEDNKISKTVDADTNAGTYKVTKAMTELAEAAWLWALGKWALESKLWGPLITKETPTALKAIVGGLEWAADMAIYEPIADQRLANAKELAIWGALWAALPIAWAWVKAAKKATQKRAVQFAEGLLQNMNRMTKWEQSKFVQRFWQNMGKRMNDRGLKTAEDLVEYFTRSKTKVDNALSAIQWRFTSKQLNDVLDDAVDFAVETKNPQSSRIVELWEKNAEWGLTMSEINEVKRFFESHNKFNYLTKGTAKQAELATNMDSALREWQYSIAEKNWFSNLAELNKETAAAKEILNGVKKREAWVVGNNPISLSDLVVAAGGGISPESLASMFVKKWLETPAAKSKIVDMLNWIGGHETMTEKVADLQRIAEVNSEKELNRLYKERGVGDATPKLDYKWMEAATDNQDFAEMLARDKPKPVNEVDLSKNNPWLQEKEVIEFVPTNPKKTDVRLDLWTDWEGLSKLRSKKADYMIVSAENFNWQAQSAWVNSKSTKAFREFLDEQGIAWKPQMWMYDNLERSQIIAIDNAEQRAIIDKWIQENAPQAENIIVKNWKAYRYDPRTNEAYYVDLKKADLDLPADATNYYSEVDGRKYQLPLYSEAEKPISVEDFLSIYNS